MSQDAFPPVHPLAPELVASLANAGVMMSFGRRSLLVREGDESDALYVVLEGEVRVFATDDEGREIELNRLGPGSYFGELMLASHRRTASVRAMTPVKVAKIDRAAFRGLLERHPSLGFHLMQMLAERVRVLSGRVQDLAFTNVYSRIARLLESQAEPDGDVRSAPFLSQQTIASRVGCSRPMANRIMQDLAAGRYIEITASRIRILRALPKRW